MFLILTLRVPPSPLVAGFTGAHCEIDINECDPDPCHYGTCKDNIAAFTCLCQPGYTGHRCDININECQSQPCKNGGTCQDRNNAYNCLCLKGTTGEREGPPGGSARVGHAARHPGPIPVPGRVGPGPPPAATLVPGPAPGVLAEGEFSRFGARLSQEPRPSRELGSRPWRRRFVVERRWQSVPAGFVLLHQRGWGPPNGIALPPPPPSPPGPNCEINLDDCASNPCDYGKCIDKINGYECTCEPGYTGESRGMVATVAPWGPGLDPALHQGALGCPLCPRWCRGACSWWCPAQPGRGAARRGDAAIPLAGGFAPSSAPACSGG